MSSAHNTNADAGSLVQTQPVALPELQPRQPAGPELVGAHAGLLAKQVAKAGIGIVSLLDQASAEL